MYEVKNMHIVNGHWKVVYDDGVEALLSLEELRSFIIDNDI
jgi:hypothetical protein